MAAEFKFPSDIDPLGEGYRKNLDFQRTQQTKVRNVTVRVGEIVRGKIQEVLSPTQAVITLPDGTFSAEISGHFNPGDELFFKVQSTEPALVLKIYSTFAKIQNKELSTGEIIRVLDLPSTQLFQKIINKEKTISNVIIRDDVLSIATYAKKIIETFPKQNIDDILNFIYLFLKVQFEPSPDLFESYFKMINFPNQFPALLFSLLSQSQYFPDIIQKKLEVIRNSTPRPTFFSIFSLLSPNNFNYEDNIFSILWKFKNSIEYRNISENIRAIIEEILAGFSSFWLLNSAFSYTNPQILFVIAPFLYKDSLQFNIFHYRRKKIGQKFFSEIKWEESENFLPVLPTFEQEFKDFLKKEENAQSLLNSQKEFNRNSRKESNRIVIKLPNSEIKIVKLLSFDRGDQRKVSIVI